MSNGIFIFVLLLCVALSLVTGGAVALAVKEKPQAEDSRMMRQWSEFLNYDGNGRE